MTDKTIFSMELATNTKDRAEAIGLDYADLLASCGAAKSTWDTARRKYKAECVANGWDPNANLGCMKTSSYQRICMGFVINVDTFKVTNPPKAETNLLADESDQVLVLESLLSKQEVTNQLLREIRNSIADVSKPDNTKEVVSRLDKIFARCQEIDSHTSHLPDIKKDGSVTRKAVASIDQRISGLNQSIASARIDISKILELFKRWASGK